MNFSKGMASQIIRAPVALMGSLGMVRCGELFISVSSRVRRVRARSGSAKGRRRHSLRIRHCSCNIPQNAEGQVTPMRFE